jgi:hypothetical protein
LQRDTIWELFKVDQLFPAKQVHYAVVNDERMNDISAEMCCLLDQQAKMLDSRPTLSALSAEEVDVYAHRNDRLLDLSKELDELT